MITYINTLYIQRMKKILLLACMIVAVAGVQAQSKDTLPPYKKVPVVPPFKLLRTDSSWFAKDDLPAKKPVVVIYFSPDCSHCQLEMKEITDSMQLLDKAFFVLASFKQMDEIKEFSDKYHLQNFSNIVVGRDTKYFIPSFYKVRFTPFIAVYDKHGKLVKAFESGAKVSELKEAIGE